MSRQTLHLLLSQGKGTLINLIAVLRAISEFERLSSLLEDVRPSPLQIMRMEGKKRRRAQVAEVLRMKPSLLTRAQSKAAIGDNRSSMPHEKTRDTYRSQCRRHRSIGFSHHWHPGGGIVIGFDIGPISVTCLGKQGDRVRCAIGRKVTDCGSRCVRQLLNRIPRYTSPHLQFGRPDHGRPLTIS